LKMHETTDLKKFFSALVCTIYSHHFTWISCRYMYCLRTSRSDTARWL